MAAESSLPKARLLRLLPVLGQPGRRGALGQHDRPSGARKGVSLLRIGIEGKVSAIAFRLLKVSFQGVRPRRCPGRGFQVAEGVWNAEGAG